ncbi:fatty acid-binding protein, liver-type-like [Chrysoperla carnea]|uniref:fatty acid-binding protein, liver-type-like n=1 Tax=Chrysoperla carnea TaxID=189513 RepID=UPI001D060F79|nr:fatty acid-binding protein, liver-type-like [Chrysoperla carnea]
MTGLNGKYEIIKDENVMEYYKAVGIPDAFIDKVGTSPPSLEITISGNSVNIKDIKDTTVELGKEFEDKTPMGGVAKCVATLEGNKLTITRIHDGKKGGHSYEQNDEGIVVTLTFEGSPVICKRYYKRV